MRVYVPTPLRSYTHSGQVQASGATLAELMQDLERQFPGMRFRMIDEQDRIRQHIHIFVNEGRAPSLAAPLSPSDRIQIVCAISGG